MVQKFRSMDNKSQIIKSCNLLLDKKFEDQYALKNELNLLYKGFFCGPVWNEWNSLESNEILKNATELLVFFNKTKNNHS